MSQQILQAVRGMNDILPGDTPYWQELEKIIRDVLSVYGYSEIRFPIVEKTELFKRSIGEVTDIVEKEMYTFEDRNGDSLTLRPEGTASCVRAGIQNGLMHNQVQRLWYMGPMFRHERPQKGRYRQFYQVGVETFGMEGPDLDAELILLTTRLWNKLGLNDLELQINSLGNLEARNKYRDILVNYFSAHAQRLDEDSKRRLETNPLRILDSKNPDMQELIENAPKLTDYLDEGSRMHFETLCNYLEQSGVNYTINPRLVRGLDYYGRTVFEWVTKRLGSQGTVCAGGRFDGLVEQLGGKSIPAAGFAMGMERLLELVKDSIRSDHLPHAYLVLVGESAQKVGILMAENIRNKLDGLRVLVNCGGGSFKSQFRKADRSGAHVALVIGDDEIKDGTVGIKYLREDKAQEIIKQQELPAWFRQSNLL